MKRKEPRRSANYFRFKKIFLIGLISTLALSLCVYLFQVFYSTIYYPSTTSSPQEIFKNVIESQIPADIVRIEGDGDTWQGHNVYLKISLSNIIYLQKLISLRNFKEQPCASMYTSLKIPEKWASKMPYWDIDFNEGTKCISSNGYSNKWTEYGTGFFAVDFKKMVIYFHEIGV